MRIHRSFAAVNGLIMLSASLLISSAGFARAEDSLQVSVINDFIKRGECSAEDKWCLVRAADSSQGFFLIGRAKDGADLQLIHVWGELLKVPSFIWQQAGGAPNVIANLLISDASGDTVFLSRKCP